VATNSFYSASGNPATGAEGLSSLMRGEFLSVQAAFDMMPRFSTTGLFDTIFAQQGSYTFTLPAAPGTLATLDDVAAVVASADTVVAAVAAEATARAEAEAAEAAARTVAITAETTRALKAENANATAIATNVTAIGVNAAAITANTTLINAETTRALEAETAILAPLLGTDAFQKTIRRGTAVTGAGGTFTFLYPPFSTNVLGMQATISSSAPTALTISMNNNGNGSFTASVAQSATGVGVPGVGFFWEVSGH
jgi:hypothetical protein